MARVAASIAPTRIGRRYSSSRKSCLVAMRIFFTKIIKVKKNDWKRLPEEKFLGKTILPAGNSKKINCLSLSAQVKSNGGLMR